MKVPWYLFGTGGNICQPLSVVKSCRLREDIVVVNNRRWHGKSIVRCSKTLHLRAHRHVVLGQTIAALPDFPVVDTGPTLSDSLRARGEDFILFQNHYNLQSREQFEIKAAKNDPMTGKPGSKYNERYFQLTEAFTNEVTDHFLYEKYKDFYDGLPKR